MSDWNLEVVEALHWNQTTCINVFVKFFEIELMKEYKFSFSDTKDPQYNPNPSNTKF